MTLLALALAWPPLLPAGLVAQTVDTNPDPPTSILAAVIFLGTVIVTGMGLALRVLWKKNEELQAKVEARDAAATNRERQLGAEVFPVVKQMTDVLQAFNQSIRVQQPAQTPPGIDTEMAARLSAAVEALEKKL